MFRIPFFAMPIVLIAGFIGRGLVTVVQWSSCTSERGWPLGMNEPQADAAWYRRANSSAAADPSVPGVD
jgi:hypothetical protein